MRVLRISFLLALWAALTGSAATPVWAGSEQGLIQVTIRDEEGSLVSKAPVYIYKETGHRLNQGKEVPGMLTFSLPAGRYRLSSALTKEEGGGFCRYASSEAYVNVVAGDSISVILTLRPLQTNPADSIEVAQYR